MPETEWTQELLEARKRAGFTQTQLAELLGRSQGEISQIERGKRALVDIHLAERWLGLCGVRLRAGSFGSEIQGLSDEHAEIVAMLVASLRAGLHPSNLATLRILLENWPVGEKDRATLMAADVRAVLNEYGRS